MVEAFLDTGPEMLDFFERETEVKFVPTHYPDYHPDAPGGVDRRPLGARRALSTPATLGAGDAAAAAAAATITFIGMMFNSSNADLKHFFNATRSLSSALYVGKRLAGHCKELALYRRGVQVTSGNALAARLAKTAFDLGIPIHTNRRPESCWVADGAHHRRRGAGRTRRPMRITARARAWCSPAAASPQDVGRIGQGLSARAARRRALSRRSRGQYRRRRPDGRGRGRRVENGYPTPAAWMPVSKVPLGDGKFGAFPHLLDRYKPGVIAVHRQRPALHQRVQLVPRRRRGDDRGLQGRAPRPRRG